MSPLFLLPEPEERNSLNSILEIRARSFDGKQKQEDFKSRKEIKKQLETAKRPRKRRLKDPVRACQGEKTHTGARHLSRPPFRFFSEMRPLWNCRYQRTPDIAPQECTSANTGGRTDYPKSEALLCVSKKGERRFLSGTKSRGKKSSLRPIYKANQGDCADSNRQHETKGELVSTVGKRGGINSRRKRQTQGKKLTKISWSGPERWRGEAIIWKGQ